MSLKVKAKERLFKVGKYAGGDGGGGEDQN